jgi:hypothetical protein
MSSASKNHSQPLPVDASGEKISGYRFGQYWLGCNGRTINGLCSDSFKSENDLLKNYDACFGHRGAAGGVVRVYEDGRQVCLRKTPEEIMTEDEQAAGVRA